ncbi:hypothetical protein BC833DRAFT_389826 [Globomyces pollinis-pini]|nr:hypothetical protein BC833DRAFT_389826 [Globomyces pollinis-pini]
MTVTITKQLESISLKPPKARKELDDLTINNIGQLRIIHKYCFEDLSDEDWLKDYDTKLIYFNDICVGGISSKHVGEIVNIAAISVLPAYRSLGLGRMLMEYLIEKTRNFKPTLLDTKPLYIAGLVNDESMGFFEKFGFVKDDQEITNMTLTL